MRASGTSRRAPRAPPCRVRAAPLGTGWRSAMCPARADGAVRACCSGPAARAGARRTSDSSRNQRASRTLASVRVRSTPDPERSGLATVSVRRRGASEKRRHEDHRFAGDGGSSLAVRGRACRGRCRCPGAMEVATPDGTVISSDGSDAGSGVGLPSFEAPPGGSKPGRRRRRAPCRRGGRGFRRRRAARPHAAAPALPPRARRRPPQGCREG